MNNNFQLDLNLIRNNIEAALSLLYKNDLLLITNNTSERAITHKLAEYIEPKFPDWDVDCEYNQIGEHLPKSILRQHTSFPDVIVHKRGRSNNLLVIEAKNSYSYHHGDKHDKDKIQAYIEDERYRYKFGVWICFYGKLSETRRDWFENIDGVCREVIDD
jgi:hypothetical protein